MVKVCLWGWVQVIIWLILAVLTSCSPIPPKRVVEKGSTVPPVPASPPSAPQDADEADDDDGYDYEYGYSSVQLLFAADSAPRKIQKPCKPGYKPRRGKCRKVVDFPEPVTHTEKLRKTRSET